MDATMSMDTDGMDDRVAAGQGAWLFFFSKGQRERGWTTKKTNGSWALNSTGTGLQRTKGSFSFCLSLAVHSPLLKLRLLPEFLGLP